MTTRWYGKLLGFIAGAAILRGNPPLGAIIGLLVGHGFDRDWFRLHRDDPYRILGVADDASQAEIDQAYRRLMSQCHPDKFATASADKRRKAEVRAREINAAYDRIRALRTPRG